ncbi:MAG: hypothetical protein J6A92_05185 [Lachnospiraceae bacterium]|nr:hypothetical protein [Lachnospiraceae bacterium]
MKKRIINVLITVVFIFLLYGMAKNTASIESFVMPENPSTSGESIAKIKQIVLNENIYTYQVTLPEGYDCANEKRKYPVVYLLPEDGISGNSDIVKQAVSDAVEAGDIVDVIIVEPAFSAVKESANTSAYEAVSAIITEVDKEYHTIADASMRAVIGTQTGGYLATILTYTNGDKSWNNSPKLFGMMASIHGDYKSDANIWKEVHGDFYEIAAGGGKGELDNRTANKFYTYMSTATEEESAYVNGGANDIIAYFIQNGSAYEGAFYGFYGNADAYVLNLTAKNSVYDETYIRTSVKEAMTGFGDKLVQNMVSGKLSLTPQAALAAEKEIEAVYEINVGEMYTTYCGDMENKMEVRISMSDTDAGEAVAEDIVVELMAKETEKGSAYTNADKSLKLPNIVNTVSTDVTLSVKLLGKIIPIETKALVRIEKTGESPEEQLVDLMGNWKFQAFRDVKLSAGALPQKADYDTWEEVYPCLTWWNGEFSQKTNMASYNGYAWYIKEFEIPSYFPEGEYYVPLGFFDETDICFINGKQIGCTGLHAKSWRHEADCWDTERVYTVSSDVLNIGGNNVITILTHNQSGDGGWYKGHPGIYTKAAYAKLIGKEEEESQERFFSQTIPSRYRAKLTGAKEETVEENFWVYLPEGYFEPGNANKRYPTAYVLHQLNSSSNSYVIDGIDELLDEGIITGKVKEMIVIIPDSTGESWWCNGWDAMVTEEILPFVDANYRTIPDARYRFLAGASMGGSGAYYIGLTNPDLFSGIVSFFGAINMGKSPLNIALTESKEYLDYFTQYFVCGNRDLYKFGIPAIALDKKLHAYGIEHFFELEEGEHDSEFYLPYAIDSFAYQSAAMPEITAEDAANVIRGELMNYRIGNGNICAVANVEITDKIKEYLAEIPQSKYAKETSPALLLPVTLSVIKDGKVLCSQTQIIAAKKGKTENMEWNIECEELSQNGQYDAVKVYVSVMNQTIEL